MGNTFKLSMHPLRSLILLLIGTLLASFPCMAQQKLSRKIKDQLRNEGNYARRSLPKVDYDFAAYKKVNRIETDYGEFQSWDYPYDPDTSRFQTNAKYRLDKPYFTRTGGVKRGSVFSADTIGKMYRNHYLLWADGLGNTLYESLKISSKYGLNHYFYAPDYDPFRQKPQGPKLPFTNKSIQRYKKEFPGELKYMTSFINEIQPLYYKSFLGNKNQLWTLFTGIDSSPLDLFLMAAERNYSMVNQEFKNKYGFDLPITYDENDPDDVIKRIKMWEYIRKQHGKVTNVRSDLFKKYVSDKGRLISNVHMSTQVDYEWYGKNFDHPGVAIRPMLSGNKLMWKYYMGYGTRLVNDLTDKLPVISPRINIPSGGARIIPTKDAVKYWYSQVVRNGAAGFYVWLKDYPAREYDKGAYGGFSYANPDPSARGEERWNVALDMAKATSQAYVFTPPSSKFGILANIADANVKQGWFDIFSAYIELRQAKVWSTFISSTELRNDSESLQRYEVLMIPKIEYLYQDVADKIRSFVENGGTAVVTDPDAFSYNMNGKNLSEYRETVLGADSVRKYTSQNNEVTFTEKYSSATVSPYRTPYEVVMSGDETAKTIATFPDNSTAVTLNKVGDGDVIYAPGLLSNIYSPSDDDVDVDTSRNDFYHWLRSGNGIESKSWIWDITVDNVDEMTGKYDHNLPKIKKNIKFRWYMNPFLP